MAIIISFGTHAIFPPRVSHRTGDHPPLVQLSLGDELSLAIRRCAGTGEPRREADRAHLLRRLRRALGSRPVRRISAVARSTHLARAVVERNTGASCRGHPSERGGGGEQGARTSRDG